MKTIPTALATHYASGTTTLADLLKITRKDGQVFAFTSASTDVTISGQLYTSAQGLDISSLEVTAGLAVDNLELTTLDDGTIFSRVEVLAGVWRNADFIISRYNWASPSDGIEVRMVGTVGEVHLKRGSITAELRGLQQYLQQPIGSVTSKTCRARLGDSLCRVDLAGYTYEGTVASSSSNQVFTGDFGGVVEGDASFSSVSLLLHGNGANGSTTFTDNSPTPKTVTAVGNSQVSTAQSKFGGASIYFDGAGDYLAIPQLITAPQFTIEAWVRVAASVEQAIFSQYEAGDGRSSCYLNSTGKLEFFLGSTPLGNLLIAAPSTFPAAQWVHVAVTRDAANAVRLFQDGVIVATGSSAQAITSSPSSAGGQYGVSFGLQRQMNGYLDDLRITNGIARYTANFTPPTAAFADSAPTVTTPADDYFADGIVTFTSGVNAGLSQKVKTFTGGVFTLALPMLQTIAPGTNYTVVAGCRKRLEDCSSKFNNVLNFQGEPHLPGVDQITAPA